MNLTFRKLEKMASDPDLLNGVFLRSDGARLLA